MKTKELSLKFKKVLKMGLAHVFGAYTLNKVISFVTNLIIVRILSKTDYGFFSSAFNIYSFFNIFTGLGMLGAELVFCSEKRSEDERQSIYKYTLLCGVLSNIFLSIGIVFYGFFANVSMEETRLFIVELSGLLVFDYLAQYVLCYFRTLKSNKKYSYFTLLNTITYLGFGCLGSFLFGVTGTIIGRYISCLIVFIFGILFSKNKIIFWPFSFRLSRQLQKQIWIYSVKNGLCTFLNQIIYLIDVFLISTIIADPVVVASYKFATLIPESLAFIPQAIIVTFIPYYLEKKNDKKWIRKTTGYLFGASMVLNLIITAVLIIAAPLIIRITSGTKYLDSIPYFRILSISFFFLASFRLFSTNLLAIFKRTTFNLVAAAITGICNIVLDLILIEKYSATGAAWATVASVIIASILTFPYLIFIIFIKKEDHCMLKRVLRFLKRATLTSDYLIKKLKKGGAKIGTGVHIYNPPSVTIDETRPYLLTIGDYTIITQGVTILTHDYSLSTLRKKYDVWIGEGKQTIIGNNVFIGMNSIILMGAVIGDNVIIGAGSVVRGTIPSNCVIAGNPATVIMSIEKHYDNRINRTLNECIETGKAFFERKGVLPKPKDLEGFKFLFAPRNPDYLINNHLDFNCHGDDPAKVEKAFFETEPIISFEDILKAIEKE